MRAIRQFLVNRFWNRAYAAGDYSSWPQEALVRRRLNRRVTGSEHLWPVDWFAKEFVAKPFARGVSLGCGEGSLERDLMSKALCEVIVGLDISAQALELASLKAREVGYTTLRYEHGDLDCLDLDRESYQAAFAHMALHHVRNLEHCFDQVHRALSCEAVLYLDEYVGPSRHQWNRALLQDAEDAYQALPKAVRGPRRLHLPVDWRDPSEAVRSADILPLLAERFEIREQRDYGGNLLSVIYPHLRLAHTNPAEREAILEQLLTTEDQLLADGEASFYTIVVASPK